MPDQNIKNVLNSVSQVLCLKESKCLFKNQQHHETINISTHIKVHVYQKGQDTDENKKDTPTKKSKDIHFFELQYELKELGYVFNTKYIYPLDSDNSESKPNLDRYLRPEFMYQYEKPLNADTKKGLLSKTITRLQEDIEITELGDAAKTLRQKIVPNLASLFDSLTIVPLDSKSLSEAFHSLGVNMRYLGYVALYSTLYHVKDICVNEMIARVLKQLLNAEISNSIKETHASDTSNEEASSYSRHPPLSKKTNSILKKTNSDSRFRSNNKLKTVGFNDATDMNASQINPNVDSLDGDADYGDALLANDKTIEWYLDFFNLAFGNTQESAEFYSECVYPIIQDYYAYPIEKLMSYEIRHIALYYSLLYHCGLSVEEESEIFDRLGQDDKPFHESNIIRPYPKYDVYSMRSLRVHDFVNKYKDYRAFGQNETALNACRSKIHYKQLLIGEHDLDAQGEIAELLLEEGLYEEAIEQARIGIDEHRRDNCAAIKFYCVLMRAFQYLKDPHEAQIHFGNAIRCLEHHWGEMHPLHITIYGIMAFLMIE